MMADGRYGDLFFVRDLIVAFVVVLLSQEIFLLSVAGERGGRVVSLMVGMGTVFL